MARAPNFDFERRERAKNKAAKRSEKTKAKAEKKNGSVPEDSADKAEPQTKDL